MAKVDRRVSRTRQRLTEALIKLTLRQGYEKTTIREFTDEADVGYATFFRHYQDKDELLHDVLEVMLAELLLVINPAVHTKEPDHAEVGKRVFVHVQTHEDLYRVLLDNARAQEMFTVVYEVGVQGVLETHEPSPRARVPADIAAHHIVASFLALIRWWLQNDKPYRPERMGEIYRDMIITPTLKLAFSLPRGNSSLATEPDSSLVQAEPSPEKVNGEA
jgi:AcrR family transcriptional regulator